MRCTTAVCLSLGASAVLGCAPRDISCDGPCGTVVVDAWGAPEALLPVFTISMDALAISSVLYLPLAEIGNDLNIVGAEGFEPRLARSWTFEDSVTIAFDMDPNARWHDGQRVTAHDVAFTFDLYRDPVINSDEVDDLRRIRAVTARDEHTVAFTFSRAYPEQFFDATYHMRIHPAHLLDTIPRASLRSHPQARTPIGNGPFRFVRWDADQTVELVADTAFFLERPGPARIVVQVIPNPNTILARLMAEETDFSVFVPPPFVEQVQQAPHLSTIRYRSQTYSFVGFNFRDPNDLSQPHPLFRHRYVREALSIAVDREAISQATFGDFGRVLSGPLSFASPLWDLDIPTIPHEAARARQLLENGGWSDSDGDDILDKDGQRLTFELIVPSSSGWRRQAATIMESQFRQIGVEMRIREMDPNTHVEQTERGRFDASFFTWSQDPEPAGAIGGAWSTTGANNYGKYSNPRFDSLVTATTNGTDPEMIRQTWREALGVIQQDWPAIWMLTLTQVSGVHSRFENAVVRPDQNWGATIWRWRVQPDHMLPRDRVGIQ